MFDLRSWVCGELAYSNEASQRRDLMDPNLTTDALIEFLHQLLKCRNGVWQGQKVCVTSVRSDHLTIDGMHGHNPGGNAIDFVDNTGGAKRHLISDVQSCSNADGIGLGGTYQQYGEGLGGYGPASKLFQDNSSDHIHVQVVNY